MSSLENAPLEVKVGGYYKALKGGKVYEAKVLHKKFISENSRDEYYVHYNGADKRTDEWLPLEKFVEETFPTDPEETKDRKRAIKGKNAHEGSNEEAERVEMTKIKNIFYLEMGRYTINTWYYSPYPDEYKELYRIYVCEFCFKYLRYYNSYKRHCSECIIRRPPGKNVYRSGTLAIYEVNSTFHQLYCQNLCLMAKLFIDHKTVFFDVNPFLFYILCEVKDTGSHFAGYFSKEKHSAEGNNLNCIMVLPPYQNKGYGKLLIDFSYTLSKLENTTGSPEKPLSDMGLVSYKSYWCWAITNLLQRTDRTLTVREISRRTGICHADALSTLERMRMIQNWKGKHTIYVSYEMLNAFIQRSGCRRPKLAIDPSCVNFRAL